MKVDLRPNCIPCKCLKSSECLELHDAEAQDIWSEKLGVSGELGWGITRGRVNLAWGGEGSNRIWLYPGCSPAIPCRMQVTSWSTKNVQSNRSAVLWRTGDPSCPVRHRNDCVCTHNQPKGNIAFGMGNLLVLLGKCLCLNHCKTLLHALARILFLFCKTTSKNLSQCG